ncbi:MAG: hypothetical protein SOI13_02170 [Bifidobacterium mongoliense]|jgi:hypothetical protein|uniref:hypothetical protein n=1 Tax=Bifidobacterium mongoliense TaxID=518643 RepID=UPI002F352773
MVNGGFDLCGNCAVLPYSGALVRWYDRRDYQLVKTITMADGFNKAVRLLARFV